MVRPFAAALRSQALVFSPVPPPSRASPARIAAGLAETLAVLDRVPRVDALGVPELVDENHDGRPYYRSADPRAFAGALAQGSGRDVLVTKVVAHLPSGEAVAAWAEETVRLGLRHAVLVGGSSRYIPYPGPPVTEANAVVGPILAGAGGLVGNIAIPQRTGEAHRMLAKTRAGAGFFTTQLVFGPTAVTELLRRYDRLCREATLVPATVLVSVAPVADETDAAFVRWLGADLPDEVEREILEPEGPDSGLRSVRNARELWATLRATIADERLSVPVGVNVEQLTGRHLPFAERLLAAVASELDRPAATGASAAAGQRLLAERQPPAPRVRTARPSESQRRPSSSTSPPWSSET